MKTTLLFGIVAASLFAGCTSRSVNTVEPTYPQAIPQAVADKIIITDDDLADDLQVVQVNEGIVGANLKKIQVTVRSTKSSYQGVNYRFTWIDLDGMAVTSPAAAWRSAQLPAGGTAYLTSVAPNPRAVDFNLELIAAGDAREESFLGL